jgi:adenylate cyclase
VQKIEIERKFLVRDAGWRAGVTKATRIRQAYLRTDGDATVRVRVREGQPATLTVKSQATGLSRLEFEYEIPTEDADAMFALRQGAIIEKVRHLVPVDGLEWEIDVFEGTHAGLVIAELELTSPTQAFALPPWVGAEVTGDLAYYNSALARGLTPPR